MSRLTLVTMLGGALYIAPVVSHPVVHPATAPRAARQPASPGALVFQSATFDSARGLFLVFGGHDAEERPTNALWGWDGQRWRLLARDGPSPRFEAHLVYDARRARTVMHGGRVNGGEFFDTWEWDGERWHRITANGPALGHAASAYDAARGVVVLYGGSRRLDPGPDGQVTSRVTWTYDGRRWVKRDTVGPPPRSAHAMAYDPHARRVVMSGGSGGRGQPTREDTWLWDGAAWSMASERGGPPGRNGHAMSTAGDDGTILLFGGSRDEGVVGETWVWRGGAWSRVEGAAPPARVMAGLAWDPVRRRVWMYGGGGQAGGLTDTWSFDPATQRWTAH